MTGYKHQTLPAHLYRSFLAMADKFQTSNTVTFKFPFWPLLYSLHKSVIFFALGYWGKKASLKCHCDQSNRTPPQARCGLKVYVRKRWHLECKPKNWVGLLCPVMWPLSFSTCFISLPQTSLSRRALALKEGRAAWAGVPAHLSRQCWLPGNCRGRAQKHAAMWHHRLLTKLVPTIALLRLLWGVSVAEHRFSSSWQAFIYPKASDDGGEQLRHRYRLCCLRGQNRNWSKHWKLAPSMSDACKPHQLTLDTLSFAKKQNLLVLTDVNWC